MQICLLIFFAIFTQVTTANDVSHQLALEVSNIDYTFESEDTYSIDDVVTFDEIRWQSAETPLNLGLSSRAVWLRFDIDNVEPVAAERVLRIANANLAEVEIYLQSGKGVNQHWDTGANKPFKQRPMLAREFAIPISFPAGKNEIYIRAKSSMGLQFPIQLYTPEAYFEQVHAEELYLGLYLGALLIFIAFNIALFLVRNDYLLILLAIDLLVYGVLHATHLGVMFHYIWPTDPEFNSISLLLFAFSLIVAATVFTWHFLNLKEFTLLKAGYWGVLICAVMGGVGIWLLPIKSVVWICGTLAIIASCFAVFLTIIKLMQGDSWAPYFACSYGLAGIGFIAYIAQELAWIPINHLSQFGLAYAVLVQGLVLTLVIFIKTDQQKYISGGSPAEIPASVRDWVAQFSHEIRTPLNGIIGMADLIKETPLNPTQYGYLRVLSSSGEHLVSLVNDVLDYESLASGKVSILDSSFEIDQLLLDCAALFEQQAKDNQIELVVDCGSEIPKFLMGDAKRIRQVVTNLLSNAIKFTHQGSVVLRGRYSQEAGLLIEVEDDGIGISPEQQRIIFERFEQADDTVYHQFGGTGLGLAICKRLVALMNGTITVKSSLNKKTTFTFNLPLNIAGEPEVSSVKGADLAPLAVNPIRNGMFSSGLTILGVDDNEINRRVLSSMLKKLGHHIVEAENGKQAVEKVLSGQSFDLILMDCEMPGMDGFEATKKIRKWQHAQPGNPCSIIALTAHSLEQHKEQCFAAGMDGHLAKPIHLDDLRQLTSQLSELKTPS